MNKYSRTQRKLPHFSDELERRYQMKYKQLPYDSYMELRNRGASREDARDLIREEMDDIWKEYRAEKLAQMEREKFHSVEPSEVPFTKTESDILEHLYRIQEESPVYIPPEYDITGEQMELVFT